MAEFDKDDDDLNLQIPKSLDPYFEKSSSSLLSMASSAQPTSGWGRNWTELHPRRHSHFFGRDTITLITKSRAIENSLSSTTLFGVVSVAADSPEFSVISLIFNPPYIPSPQMRMSRLANYGLFDNDLDARIGILNEGNLGVGFGDGRD
ncbi:hypothetical protein C1H46_023496 [Malus baccata]|uniref:Uncharacterized protein n=1 Tax=Malus baccata TaxID=106549 RepID=A0A540LWV0_MALBA|nr:hypothetical protein C1H46_023496 [Malus baccata]